MSTTRGLKTCRRLNARSWWVKAAAWRPAVSIRRRSASEVSWSASVGARNSAELRITVSRLLKSWAMPPASLPTVSRRRELSISRRIARDSVTSSIATRIVSCGAAVAPNRRALRTSDLRPALGVRHSTSHCVDRVLAGEDVPKRSLELGGEQWIVEKPEQRALDDGRRPGAQHAVERRIGETDSQLLVEDDERLPDRVDDRGRVARLRLEHRAPPVAAR